MGFCLNKELEGIVNKITSVDKIGFFFGAGTSMSLGVPGIIKLTEDVIAKIDCEDKLENIISQIKTEKKNTGIEESQIVITIEDILNKIRIIRDLTKDSASYKYCEISGEEAKQIDNMICKEIYTILHISQNAIGENINVPLKFVSWLNGMQANKPKEIFTANYDLILEMAMEKLYIPYFDGFIGSNKPFFYQDSVEISSLNNTVPYEWIRLWKIHGSLGWFWENDDSGYRIIRLGSIDLSKIDNELVIYPSKEKYHASRKQPFISYFDRLKNHLSNSEGIFIVSGYSFGDEHINDVIFESLTRNNRMHVIAFLYTDGELDKIAIRASMHPNMSVFSPTKAIIGSKVDIWDVDTRKLADNDFTKYTDDSKLLLGDFKVLVDFFINNSVRRREVMKAVGAKNE